MKRWPIGLAVIGILLAAGIGVCVRDDRTAHAPIESTSTNEPASVPAPTVASEPSVDSELLTSDAAAIEAERESRRAVEQATAAAAALVLDVVAPDGSPVPHVRLVLARAETVIENQFAESGGRVTLPALGRNVDVFVLTGSTMRVRQHLDDAVGHHVLKIPAGVAMRGTVLVDNVQSDEGVWLHLSSRDESVGLDAPPPFVQRQIDFRGYEGRPSISVRSDASGRFEFRDLPAQWIGTLDFSGDFRWESGGPLPIDDVSREVVVRLRSAPMIRGRVVLPDSSEGAANAFGYYAADCEGGGWASADFYADADGRFQLRMPCKGVTKFDGTVALAGVGRAAVALLDVPQGGIDVGDVVLEPARDIYFVTHDRDGRPIAGAIASTFDEKPMVSGPSDGAGLGSLTAVPMTTDLIRVVALGFRSVMRGVNSGEATPSAPLDIPMESIGHLEFAIEQRDGTPAPDVYVRLTCRGAPPFISGEDGDGSHPIHIDLGAPQPGVRRTRPAEGKGEAEYEMRYAAGSNGRLRIPGINPLARLVARIEDMTGAVLAERDVDPALVGSGTPCRIRFDGAPRTLELVVLDTEGAPIRAAKVRANFEGAVLGETLSDGLVQIAPIYARKVDLRVEAPSYSTAQLGEVSLTRDIERREVVLTHGRTVQVEVVDSVGTVIAADGVDAKYEGRRVGKVSPCPVERCFRIDDLPPDRIELSAFVSGVRFTKEHDAREELAVFEVPAYGSVLVEFSEPLSQRSRFVVVLAPEPGADGAASNNAEIMRLLPNGSPATSFEVATVFPGSYTVQVREMRPAEGTQALRAGTEGVVVRAGQRTVVRAEISR
jgi:hypothetical protein